MKWRRRFSITLARISNTATRTSARTTARTTAVSSSRANSNFKDFAARGNTDRVVVRQMPHGPVSPFFS